MSETARTPRVTTGALKRLIDCERRLWLTEHARTRGPDRKSVV